MYPDEQVPAMPLGANLPGRTRLTNEKEYPPLGRALNEQGEQLDRLGALLSELEQRLATVRRSVPQNSEMGAPDYVPSSPMVDQVNGQVGVVRNLQGRVRNLLEELEV